MQAKTQFFNGYPLSETMIPKEMAHSTTNSLDKSVQPQPNYKYDLYFHSREIPMALGQQSNRNPMESSTSNIGKF